MKLADEIVPRFSSFVHQNALDYVGTAAHVAARHGRLRMLELLYQHGMHHNRTNSAGHLVAYTLVQELPYQFSTHFLGKVAKILDFLIKDRRAKGAAYPMDTDHITQINDLIDIYTTGLKQDIVISYGKFRDALMLYLKTPEAEELFQGSRSNRAFHAIGSLMDVGRTDDTLCRKLARLCLDMLTMFPNADLVGVAGETSLVQKFLFSPETLTKDHRKISDILVSAGVVPSLFEFQAIFNSWLCDPERRRLFPLRICREHFSRSAMLPVIDSAWMNAVSEDSEEAVEELSEHWPPPSHQCARNVIREALEKRPERRYLEEVLQLEFEPLSHGIEDGNPLHILVKSFIVCPGYGRKRAMAHARLLMKPPGGRRGIDPRETDYDYRTPRQYLEKFNFGREGWDYLRDFLRMSEMALQGANTNSTEIQGEDTSDQSDEMDWE